MPSHIFVRLGMWQDSITSNVAAQAAGARAAEAHQPNRIINARDGFPELLVLQSGQLAKARAVIMDEHHVVGATDKSMKTHMDELNDRLLVELHNWKDAANLAGRVSIYKNDRGGSIEKIFPPRGPTWHNCKPRQKSVQERKKGNYTGAPDK